MKRRYVTHLPKLRPFDLKVLIEIYEYSLRFCWGRDHMRDASVDVMDGYVRRKEVPTLYREGILDRETRRLTEYGICLLKHWKHLSESKAKRPTKETSR